MAEQQSIATGRLALDDATVQDFAAGLRGEVLRPDDEGYDETRKIHNGMIDRRPTLIARCAGVADVIASVQFAREQHLLVSVRCGGHSVPGFSVSDGGLMIDLSPMRGVRVDAARRTVRVEGGVTWGDFDHETQAFGLATTGGVARPTGIAGLTLGGGHGFLMRKYGLACDNLLSVDLVTAEGNLLKASADKHDDLFWGLRGGGGNFGVATSFEYRLHEVGPILGGMLIYPLARAKEILRVYRDVTSAAPDDLFMHAILATLPDGTQAVAILVCYAGPVAEGERLLSPLRASGLILDDQVGPMPYIALQSIVENVNPPGMRNYWKSDFLTQLSDDVIDLLVEEYPSVPAPHTHLVIEQMGGAVSRIGEDETAVSHRNAGYNAILVGMWANTDDDERTIGWVRRLWEALRPFSSGGVYVNYMMGNEGEDRVRAAYGPEKYQRLVTLKNKYDPNNVFRLNQNIKPTEQSRVPS
jgi:FAD/FMN-containing dehydrogenase